MANNVTCGSSLSPGVKLNSSKEEYHLFLPFAKYKMTFF